MRRLTAFDQLTKHTSRTWFSIALTILRIGLGLSFLMAGIDKFGGWSAEMYLRSASGPFAEWFQTMAGSVLVDQLNIWGLIAIGLALIFGLFVRPASFFGAILMALYYFAHFDTNTAYGLIDSHIIYICVFALFLTGGIGHVYGLDGLVSQRISSRSIWRVILFG